MKVKINYRKDLFRGYNGLCESVFCAPFEDPIKFKEDKFENNRFDDVVNNGSNYLEYTSIEDCDYVIIPYKWDSYSFNSADIIREAKKYGKKVITLHNDDYYPVTTISPEDGYMFTTTLNSKSRKVNEFSFPAFTGDFFNSDNQYSFNMKIGFCGAITHQLRGHILSILSNSNKIETDFLVRRGFWAPEMTKDEARIGYMKNMTDNTFILCMRGEGNFSYRLYETMMMGRIPIIIDSEQVFPFDNVIDYSKFSIRIDINNINSIEEIIYNKIKSFTKEEIMTMQKNSREAWLEYFSPLGWIKNFHKEI